MSTTSFDPVPGSLVVAPREGRTANPLTIGGQEVFIKVAGADTNDGLSCMFHTVPPITGPPLHQHKHPGRLDRMFVEASALPGENVAAQFGPIGAKYGLTVKGPPLKP